VCGLVWQWLLVMCRHKPQIGFKIDVVEVFNQGILRSSSGLRSLRSFNCCSCSCQWSTQGVTVYAVCTGSAAGCDKHSERCLLMARIGEGLPRSTASYRDRL